MYKDHIPDLISTIIKLRNSQKMHKSCIDSLQDINNVLLTTVITNFKKKEEYEFIFMRLKSEFKSEGKNSSVTQETIIQWYTQMFQTYSGTLFDSHQDIFEGLIENLNFENQGLVQRIMYLVCMLSDKNEEYSRKVME